MTTKDLLKQIERNFHEKLQEKTGWGRNEVISLYKDATNEVLADTIDELTIDLLEFP